VSILVVGTSLILTSALDGDLGTVTIEAISTGSEAARGRLDISVRDLVGAKRSQRSEDWPMRPTT
jgi:hypothetical protein